MICREPKSLQAVLYLLTDDLLIGQEQGYRAIDMSRALGTPGRQFYCKVCLLFCVGDYPAQAVLSGFKHKGHAFCHWCEAHSVALSGVKRENCLFRTARQLPAGHEGRLATGDWAGEDDEAPAARTSDGVKRSYTENAAYAGPTKGRPNIKSGIKHVCPLVYLFQLNIIWDVLPDWTHVGMGIMKSHLFPLFSKNRRAKTPKALPMVHKVKGKQVAYSDAEIADRTKRNKDNLADQQRSNEVFCAS